MTATSYHVFTHERDEWFDIYKEAYVLYKQWVHEYGSARLYIETYIGDELDSEDCLEATGDFPW